MELIIDFILITGIVIDGIILFLLLKKENKELSQNILIVLFVFMLFELIFSYTFLHEIYFMKSISIIFSSSISWVLGPLVYLYIKSLYIDQDKLIRKNLIHFTPYIFIVLLKFISYFMYYEPLTDKFTYLELFEKRWIFEIILPNIHFIIYLLLTLRLFYRFKMAIKSNYSNLSEHDFTWIKYMIMGFLLIISIDTLYIVILGSYSLYGFYMTIITMIIVIIYLGYYGINQSRILFPDFLITEQINNDISTNKNQLSSLDIKEIEALKLKLEYVFENDKPYLDQDLTLKKLSDTIDITDKKLSTLLNQYMNISFYDYINKYRVEAFKEKMKSKDNEKYSLLGLAYDCGFNSKSSFLRIFKKETELTPSKYKKLNKL